jgi:serine/threonine-protein kinase
VSAALPGGDPLAEALAAGETPSPAMVAAAGENQGLKPRTAVALLAVFGVLFAAVYALIAYDGFTRHVPFDYPPDVLANKAEDLMRSFGFAEKPVDRAYGLYWHADYTQYVSRERKEADRWRPMREGLEPGVLFWYRASDVRLVASDFAGDSLAIGRVGLIDPPPVRAGDRRVWLDTKGRLSRYEAVPPQIDRQEGGAPREMDWAPLFVAAGLDQSRFTATAPEWVPLAGFDARAAWTGTLAARTDTPLRVEAASWRGRPVFFRVIAPWTRPERQRSGAPDRGLMATLPLGVGAMILLAVGGVVLARHNVASGRADLRGAGRLAFFVVGLMFTGWVLSADHVLGNEEVALLIMGTAKALFSGGLAWLLYVALEPFVRRRWPHTVITWNRLLAGRFKDGLFGRDLLIGSVLGLALAVLFFGELALGRALGPYDPEPITPVLLPLLSPRLVGAAFVSLLYDSIMRALTIFSLVFILLLVLRRTWAAALAFLVMVALQSLGSPLNPAIEMAFRLAMMAGLALVLFRYGLVAFAVGNFVLMTVGGGFPLVADPSRWYTGPSLLAFAGLVAVAVIGFRLSIGSKKVMNVTLEP